MSQSERLRAQTLVWATRRKEPLDEPGSWRFVVHDGRRLLVDLFPLSKPPRASCTCRRAGCAHLRAVTLFLEREQQRPAAGSVVDWADAHGLADVLDGHSRGFELRYPVAPIFPGESIRMRLRALEAEPPSTRRDEDLDRARAWAELVLEHRRTAEQERRARDERAAPPEPLTAAWAALDARRRAVAHNAPPTARVLYATEVSVGDDPFHATVHIQPVEGVSPALWRCGVTVGLEHWRSRLTVHCDCLAGDLCPHEAMALEAVQDLLLDDAPNGHAQQLRDGFLSEPWQRSFARLAPTGRNWELCFQLEGHSDSDSEIRNVIPQRRIQGAAGPRVKLAPNQLSELALSPSEANARHWLADLRRGGVRTDAVYRVLDALVGHPRVFDPLGNAVEVRRLTATLRVTEVPGGFSLTLEPALAGLSDSLRRWLASRLVRGPTQTAFLAGGWCLVLSVPPPLTALMQAVERLDGFLPAEAGGPLAERLDALRPWVRLELPPTLAGAQRPPDPTPLVLLRLEPDGGLGCTPVVQPLPSGAQYDTGQGPERVYAVDEGVRVWALRNFDDERAARAELERDLPDVAAGRIDPDRALAVAQALEARGRVAWDGGPLRISPPPKAQDLRLRIQKDRGWFTVDGSVALEHGEVALAALLEAMAQHRPFVRVGANRLVPLSEELKQRLALLAAVTHRDGDTLAVHRHALPALDVAEADAPEEWNALARRLATARAEPAALPPGLNAELRDYQSQGFQWLAALGAWGAGAVLADDQGLGKTLQSIALLLHRAPLGPALVVAPTSVCGNWLAEAKRFAPGLNVRLHHGEGRSLDALGPGVVVVTSYGVLTRDAEQLVEIPFATVVFDEAHALKNPGTVRAKAAQALQADFRVALSGTPIENHLGELWGLFRVVVPGLLGREEVFRQRFIVPIEVDHDSDARQVLARMIRPFVLRRLKAEVAAELPAKTEVTLQVVPSGAERAKYEAERRLLVMELQRAHSEDLRFLVLAGLTRLRQLACHPALVDADWTAGSAKLEQLLALVETLRAAGHKALVFSQFVRLLELVRPALEALGVRVFQLDGSTPQPERVRLVERFQAGEADVFLISLKAGGVGLNLTAASYVLHLDPWWNPASEDQATDRAHRIGQTQPVTVYRLVTTGTIEEKVLALHAEKRALVAGVLSGTGAAGTLAADELLALVRGDDVSG